MPLGTLVLASLAFGAGGAFMKPSQGFTRVGASAAVTVCFLVGAVLLTRAVERGGLATTYVVGLGLEALVTVGVGLALLGERLTPVRALGILLVLAGLVTVHASVST